MNEGCTYFYDCGGRADYGAFISLIECRRASRDISFELSFAFEFSKMPWSAIELFCLMLVETKLGFWKLINEILINFGILKSVIKDSKPVPLPG